MQAVKARPPSKRQLRAAETRRRMLSAANDLFAQQGYVATSMAAIAKHAGVAVQTVHFTFHTKARLLVEVIEVYAAGPAGATPVMERPWMREALESRDPFRTLALAMEHGLDIYERIAALEPAAIAAATLDGEFAVRWQAISDGRHAGQRRLIEHLDELGALCPGLSVDRATDILTTVNSHAVFLSLRVRCGWDLTQCKAFLFDTLARRLLDGASPERLRKATAGFSYAEQLAADLTPGTRPSPGARPRP
jgi:TetR/AcrR family transcriptional regulator of autoinduction and epiphytic fitness